MAMCLVLWRLRTSYRAHYMRSCVPGSVSKLVLTLKIVWGMFQLMVPMLLMFFHLQGVLGFSKLSFIVVAWSLALASDLGFALVFFGQVC